MSNKITKTAVLTLALTSAFALAACNVDQTEEGELPDVDVSAEGGNLPEYDVETADVEIGTETQEVEVPTVDVDMPEDDTPDAEEQDSDGY